MGLPGLPKGLDNIGEKIEQFLTLLTSIDAKLNTLIDIERAKNHTPFQICAACHLIDAHERDCANA